MKIKFFVIPIYPYGNDTYYHEVIGLAEGLLEEGYEVKGNVNYWFQPEKNEFLLKEDESNEFDLAIYDFRYVKSFEHLLFRPGYPNFDFSKRHILLDRNDWITPIWHNNKHYKIFDKIFAGHLLSNVKYPENVVPWAIGLTTRIIKSIDFFFNDNIPFDPVIGHNFRVGHNMRKHVMNGLVKNIKNIKIERCYTDHNSELLPEADKFYYKKTIGRHNPTFYNLLNEKLMFMAFGGYFEYKPFLYQPYSFLDKIKRKYYYYKSIALLKDNKDIAPAHFMFQYDSFRMWEVLYSRSCPIILNFESWNFMLPVNPIDGIHYLGINNFDFQEFAARIENMSFDEIHKIGLNGRKWVLEHYSPIRQANRFIDNLKL